MLEVKNRFSLILKKCLSNDMFSDLYLNRGWIPTGYASDLAQKSKQRNDDSATKFDGEPDSLIRPPAGRGPSYVSRDYEFSLMTYNLLSETALNNHRELYRSCPHGSLDWYARRDRLARELSDCGPDIFCLQEVDLYHHAHFFKPILNNLGYNGVYKKRFKGMQDGCALYYKESEFSLLQHHEIRFFRQDVSSLLNRANVAIIGIFKPLKSSCPESRLIVATTHLLFNPTRGDVKLAQIRLLLAELDKVLKQLSPSERRSSHTILCGDMNSEPSSPLFRFITEGYLNTKGYSSGDLSGQKAGAGRGRGIISKDLNLRGITRSTQYGYVDNQIESLSRGKSKESQYDDSEDNHQHDNVDESFCVFHNLKFSSVYPTHDDQNQPLLTTYHDGASSMVDYIFFSRSDHLKLLGYAELLNPEQLSRFGPLPNLFLGSDHQSLQAKFLVLDSSSEK